MSTTTTSYMGLILPTPTSEPGPAWAVELNTALTTVDAHDHTSGKGTAITPAALNMTGDLTLNTHNLTNVRSTRYAVNGSPLVNASGDALCAYVSGVDLYYNDGTNQIRLTAGGSITGAAGNIGGISGTAAVNFNAGLGTFQFIQATSTAGNLDVGSIAIRYPGSYPGPAGNYIQLQAPSSLASGYAITLPALPASSLTTVMTLSNAGVMSNVAIKQPMMDIRTVSSAPAAAGTVLLTNASGVDGTTSSSWGHTVTNLSGSLICLGNPVMITLQPDGSTTNDSWVGQLSSSGLGTLLAFLRNGTRIAIFAIPQLLVPTSFTFLDTNAGAGTNTYSVQICNIDNTYPANVYYARLSAYEVK